MTETCDYSAGFTIQPDGSMKPNKLGTYVRTVEESLAIDNGFCWDGSDWSEEDVKENGEWNADVQRMLDE